MGESISEALDQLDAAMGLLIKAGMNERAKGIAMETIAIAAEIKNSGSNNDVRSGGEGCD